MADKRRKLHHFSSISIINNLPRFWRLSLTEECQTFIHYNKGPTRPLHIKQASNSMAPQEQQYSSEQSPLLPKKCDDDNSNSESAEETACSSSPQPQMDHPDQDDVMECGGRFLPLPMELDEEEESTSTTRSTRRRRRSHPSQMRHDYQQQHPPTLLERALLVVTWGLVLLTMGGCYSVLRWQSDMEGISSYFFVSRHHQQQHHVIQTSNNGP